ncbi:MAG TPA: dihydroneopterin aldolase [Bdellovibrionales bacterium]|nr:dihydroneopterin aldolase [Bdellovibrionales bacterium]
MNAALDVSGLVLWARLGCSEAERAHPQEVRANLHLRFRETPGACYSDALTETICYAELCGLVKNVCESGEFATVERMTMACHARLREYLGEAVAFTVELHKVHPPIPNLTGGVRFRLE